MTHTNICEHGSCSYVHNETQYNCNCDRGYEGRNCSQGWLSLLLFNFCFSTSHCINEITCKLIRHVIDKYHNSNIYYPNNDNIINMLILTGTITTLDIYKKLQQLCGIFCSDINECEPNPCHHGVNCTDKLADYECACPDTWKGKNCEIGKI